MHVYPSPCASTYQVSTCIDNSTGHMVYACLGGPLPGPLTEQVAPFMQGLESQPVIVIPQSVPWYPVGQLQLKPVLVTMHVPPFPHGFRTQICAGLSQEEPV